jgi:hypothetical protein
LQNLGVRLENVVSPAILADPRVCAVSSLTQLDPSGPGDFYEELPQDGSVLMMSRGMLPSSIPQQEVPLDVWSRLEAGWMHGLSGTLAHVFRRDSRPGWDLFPWRES